MLQSMLNVAREVHVKKKHTGGEDSTNHVIEFVRGLIDRGELRPGSRLPAERDLATRIGVSRPTVRAELRASGMR